MKNLKIIATILILVLVLSNCGATKVINNVEYDTYGLLSENDDKNPNIKYDVIWGNMFWGIVLIETIIAPIYFFGYSLFEPVSEKPEIKGQVVK